MPASHRGRMNAWKEGGGRKRGQCSPPLPRSDRVHYNLPFLMAFVVAYCCCNLRMFL